MKIARIFFLVSLLLAPRALKAEDWPQWRGPHFNGSSQETGLPANWSKGGALWTADLPGPSAATPVIWGDLVFVSSTDPSSQTLHAFCLDRRSGKVLWQRQTGESMQHDEMSNFASPSPTADAERVYFFYGNGTLAAFDHSGKSLWSRSITKDYGEFAFQWTFSSSPMLSYGKLYLQVLQRNVPVNGRGRADGPIDSFLLAMDPATGKTLWKVTRPSDAAAESHEAYSTPIPYSYGGRDEIIIAGGDCLTGHDPQTGQELWRWGTWNPRKIGHWRLVPSPAVGAGVALVCAPKGSPVYAIKADGNGLLDDSAILWKTDRDRQITSDVPTPLFYQGDFFILSDVRKNLSRVEPRTGTVKWITPLPGRRKFEASPTGADGKIYLMNFAGEVAVIDATSGAVLSDIAMGDEGDDRIRSTIAVADGDLFIRTNHKLYCVGKK